MLLLNTNARSGRSPTIVAAYLMYSRQMDADAAIALIRQSRPDVEYALHKNVEHDAS